jgi:hypothetical protein
MFDICSILAADVANIAFVFACTALTLAVALASNCPAISVNADSFAEDSEEDETDSPPSVSNEKPSPSPASNAFSNPLPNRFPFLISSNAVLKADEAILTYLLFCSLVLASFPVDDLIAEIDLSPKSAIDFEVLVILGAISLKYDTPALPTDLVAFFNQVNLRLFLLLLLVDLLVEGTTINLLSLVF